MLPDPGCYEERYRLTGQAAAGLAIGLISVGLGVFVAAADLRGRGRPSDPA